MADDRPPGIEVTRPRARAPYAHGRQVEVVVDSRSDDLVVSKTGTNPRAVAAIEREALVLSQLRHPNVVELVDSARGDGTATLVTQFAGRTTLADLRPSHGAAVAALGASLITIVAELHRMGWVHGRVVEEHCIVGPGGRLTLCALGAAHRARPDDPRIATDLDDAVAVVQSVAARLAEPHDRAERRRHRELLDALAGTRVTDAAGAERLRERLATIAGTRAGPMVEVATTRSGLDATTARPAGPRSGRPVAPRSWRVATASFASLVGLIGVIALLRWLGGPLTGDASSGGVAHLAEVPPPVAVALDVVRLVAIAAALYGVALSAATFAAVVTRRPDVAHVATALAPPRLRAALAVVLGLGLASSTVSPAATAPVRHPVVPPPVRPAAAATTTVAPLPDPAGTAVGAADPVDSPAPDREPAAPPTATPAVAATDTPADAALPRLWVIEPGDHLWHVASATLGEHLGRAPSDAEVTPYWERVVELNRASLADPDNPDLVFIGQVVELPPLP